MATRDMQSKSLAGNKPTASTQAFLDVAEIKNGTIVLRDGSLRGVIVVSATNFSLKSGAEQNALIGAYQSFLNSLEFPIQILMQSRRLDINSYLEKMREVMQEQTNELLRLQTQEYIEYVGKLVEFASIMNKTFYVVVPFSVEAANPGMMARLSSLFNPAGAIKLKKEDFERNRENLVQRLEQVSGDLSAMGLRTIILGTEELIELVYNSYNLDTASTIRVKSVEDLAVTQGLASDAASDGEQQ